MRTNLIVAMSLVGLSAAPAVAGEVLLNKDFEDGAAGFDRVFSVIVPPPNVQDGRGVGGSRGLVLQDATFGGPPEGFWNLRPGGLPVRHKDTSGAVLNSGVMRASWFNFMPDADLNGGGFPADRQWFIFTSSDANKTAPDVVGAGYHAVAAFEMRNDFIDNNGKYINRYEVFDGAIAAPVNESAARGQYYKIDWHIQIFNPIAYPQEARGFTRILSENLQQNHGVRAFEQVKGAAPWSPDGEFELRAFQIFSNTASAGWQAYDNLKVEILDASDIDAVTTAVHAAGGGPAANLLADYTNDGTLSDADVTQFVEVVMGTRRGDTNLDGKVDVSDLGALASNWQQSAGWAGGDFNGDGIVDVSDLGALASFWQFDRVNLRPPPAGGFAEALALFPTLAGVIPEPGAVAGLLALGALALRRRGQGGL